MLNDQEGFVDGTEGMTLNAISWMAVRAASAFLGKTAALLPLAGPTAAESESMAVFALTKPGQVTASAPPGSRPSGAQLGSAHILQMAQFYVRALMLSKHFGVVAACTRGFLALLQCLLRGRSPQRAPVVQSWLRALLDQVLPATGDDSWVRRSAGLPFCFLALLQAQSSHTESSLISSTLRALLRAAREDNADWRSRVHALNVMRAVLQDSMLTVDSMPVLGEALEIFLRGFCDANWAVRNAALMAFTAAVQRAVPTRTDRLEAVAAVADSAPKVRAVRRVRACVRASASSPRTLSS
jgi:hypothetical protein